MNNGVNSKEFNIKMNVREKYINLAYKKSILFILNNRYELLKQVLKIEKDQSSEDDIDVIQAQIAINKLEGEISVARKDVKEALLKFNEVLNIADKERFDIIDNNLFDNKLILDVTVPDCKLEIPSVDDIIKAGIQNMYDVMEAKKKIETAKYLLSQAKRQRIPDIELQSGWAFENKHSSDDGTFKNGAYLGVNF